MRRLLPLLSATACLLSACATTSRWGAMEDPAWSARIGQASLADVTRSLGQPVAQLPLPSGDMKVRWFGEPLTVSGDRGTMHDDSVQHTETRAYWRDMRFDKNGRLTRAWFSDQRELVNSEGP